MGSEVPLGLCVYAFVPVVCECVRVCECLRLHRPCVRVCASARVQRVCPCVCVSAHAPVCPTGGGACVRLKSGCSVTELAQGAPSALSLFKGEAQ